MGSILHPIRRVFLIGYGLPWQRLACVGLFLALRPTAYAVASTSPWKALESRKATISKIEVEIGDVFDLSKPVEVSWIGHMANHLHSTTRETVIRRVLLFAEGDRVRERQIYETERLLRALLPEERPH